MTDDLVELRQSKSRFTDPPQECAKDEAGYRKPGDRFIIVRRCKQKGFWPLRWDAGEWIVSYKYGPIVLRVGHGITRQGALRKLHHEEDDVLGVHFAMERDE